MHVDHAAAGCACHKVETHVGHTAADCTGHKAKTHEGHMAAEHEAQTRVEQAETHVDHTAEDCAGHKARNFYGDMGHLFSTLGWRGTTRRRTSSATLWRRPLRLSAQCSGPAQLRWQ